jgi:hypothetical protein
MRRACAQAEAALALPIEAVDDAFWRGYAEENPEMVTAFLTMAGSALQALMLKDTIH